MKKAPLRFGLLLALCVCASVAHAQTVQVLDTLYNADGTTASGRAVISWEPFTAADLTTVDGGTLTYTIPAAGINAGVVDVSLFGNAGATPAGTSYAVRYFLSNGAQYTETWVVPASGPVTIADVRILNAPVPGSAIPISTLTGGPLAVSLGGTGLDALGGANLCLKVNSAGTALEYGSCAAGGTGITSLNGQVGTSQTFAAGTGGSDFNIASSSDVHTLNLPSASGTSRGALTSADWTAFDSKQPALSTSGAVANQFVTGFTAPNTFTRAQPAFSDLAGAAADAQIPDTITIDLAALATAATALAANGTNCSGNNFALGVDASGNGECGQPAFSNLSGAATDAQIPDNVTIDLATLATTATTATTANAGDSATAFFSTGTVEAARLPNLENLNGTLDVSSGGTGGAPGAGDQALVSDSTSSATWRSIPDCNTEQMLTYTAATNTFGCEADDGGGGGMTSFDIDGDNNSPQTITNGNEALFAGGTGVSTTAAVTDTVTISFNFATTLAGNPAFNAKECVFTTTGTTGGGILCEGTTANTNEQLYALPAVDGADTTNFFAVDNTQITNVDGSGLGVSTGNLNVGAGTGITVNADTLQLRYNATLAGNIAFIAKECMFTTEGTSGGGFLCEGTTANTNEQLYLFPALDGADTTTFIALGASDGDALAGDTATNFFDLGQIEPARGGTGIDTSGSTGVARVASGTWSADATLAHLAASSGQIDDDDLAAGAVDGGSGGEIADGTITSDDLATANKTFKCNLVLFDSAGLLDTDDIATISDCSRPGRAITITEVHCETDAGSPQINLQRDDGSPANILSSDLTCTTGGANGTIAGAEDNFAATDKMDFVMVTASTATRVSVLIEYTID